MDAFSVATFGAATIVTAVAISGDIAGACDAIGSLFVEEVEVVAVDTEYETLLDCIEQYGTEWDQIEAGWE